MPGIDIILAVLAALLLVAGGPALGYWYAIRRLKSRKRTLDKRERALRQLRVELEREQFQSSTSRIHSTPSGSLPDGLKGIREELEQKSLELSILREESDLEIRTLREENEALRDELDGLASTDAEFEDILPAEDVAADQDDAIDEADEADTVSETDEGDEVDKVSETDQADEAEELDEPVVNDSGDEENGAVEIAESAPDQKSADKALQDENEPKGTPRDQPEREERIIPPDMSDYDFSFHWTPSPIPYSTEQSSDGHNSELPEFKPMYTLMRTTGKDLPDDALLQDLLELEDDQYELLRDLGYASLRKIAHLSSAEVTRVSEIFGLSERLIYTEWITMAQNRLYRSSD